MLGRTGFIPWYENQEEQSNTSDFSKMMLYAKTSF